MRLTPVALAFLTLCAQATEPVRTPDSQNDQGNGAGGRAEAISKKSPDSVNPGFPKSLPQIEGFHALEEQAHTNGRQSPGAPEKNPGNQGHPNPENPQSIRWIAWLSLENWPAILALLANFPTWIIAIRYGRRQARAAEESVALTRQSMVDARRPDGRWSRFELYAGGAVHDGDNLFRATFQNYGSQPVTVLETRFPAVANGGEAPFRLVRDVNGVLEPGASAEAWVEFRFPEGAGTAVHDHHAKLSITCEAVLIGGDGSDHIRSDTFDFDRELYGFRLRRAT